MVFYGTGTSRIFHYFLSLPSKKKRYKLIYYWGAFDKDDSVANGNFKIFTITRAF